MNYFLKGLIRIPFQLVKIIFLPILMIIIILVSIFESIQRLGGKELGDYDYTLAEKIVSKYWRI